MADVAQMMIFELKVTLTKKAALSSKMKQKTPSILNSVRTDKTIVQNFVHFHRLNAPVLELTQFILVTMHPASFVT